MFLGLLSLGYVAVRCASEKIDNAQYDRRRQEYERVHGKGSWYIKDKPMARQITDIANLGLKIPYTKEQLAYIRNRVLNKQTPYYNYDVLYKYYEETGEVLHYLF